MATTVPAFQWSRLQFFSEEEEQPRLQGCCSREESFFFNAWSGTDDDSGSVGHHGSGGGNLIVLPAASPAAAASARSYRRYVRGSCTTAESAAAVRSSVGNFFAAPSSTRTTPIRRAAGHWWLAEAASPATRRRRELPIELRRDPGWAAVSLKLKAQSCYLASSESGSEGDDEQERNRREQPLIDQTAATSGVKNCLDLGGLGHRLVKWLASGGHKCKSSMYFKSKLQASRIPRCTSTSDSFNTPCAAAATQQQQRLQITSHARLTAEGERLLPIRRSPKFFEATVLDKCTGGEFESDCDDDMTTSGFSSQAEPDTPKTQSSSGSFTRAANGGPRQLRLNSEVIKEMLRSPYRFQRGLFRDIKMPSMAMTGRVRSTPSLQQRSFEMRSAEFLDTTPEQDTTAAAVGAGAAVGHPLSAAASTTSLQSAALASLLNTLRHRLHNFRQPLLSDESTVQTTLRRCMTRYKPEFVRSIVARLDNLRSLRLCRRPARNALTFALDTAYSIVNDDKSRQLSGCAAATVQGVVPVLTVGEASFDIGGKDFAEDLVQQIGLTVAAADRFNDGNVAREQNGRLGQRMSATRTSGTLLQQARDNRAHAVLVSLTSNILRQISRSSTTVTLPTTTAGVAASTTGAPTTAAQIVAVPTTTMARRTSTRGTHMPGCEAESDASLRTVAKPFAMSDSRPSSPNGENAATSLTMAAATTAAASRTSPPSTRGTPPVGPPSATVAAAATPPPYLLGSPSSFSTFSASSNLSLPTGSSPSPTVAAAAAMSDKYSVTVAALADDRRALEFAAAGGGCVAVYSRRPRSGQFKVLFRSAVPITAAGASSSSISGTRCYAGRVPLTEGAVVLVTTSAFCLTDEEVADLMTLMVAPCEAEATGDLALTTAARTLVEVIASAARQREPLKPVALVGGWVQRRFC